ncbi:hypothetical protein [Azospirillum sp. SYSU D00513]|uniref:hypothetical protein n=1 Tax=Azospirillum sp. SYSU D00513 TaxID=2812561 RepID=UPI001A96B3B0|nr:hypothetical protein [Azospirillum sp. SYSU D00513]
MKQDISFRLDEEILEAARAKAERENRTLTNYVEALVRRDLGLPQDEEANDGFVLWAPDDVRDYTLVRDEDETDESYQERKGLIEAILASGGR